VTSESPAGAAAAGTDAGHHRPSSHGRTRALALLALGIVYGDIGTSPLYALRETFHEGNGLLVERSTVLGVASLVLWSLVVVITVKYLLLVMRADADGEGGILALTSLLRRGGGARAALVLLGVFGTALLYGDGAITPAISVLSAVEGLEVVTDAAEPLVLPLSVAILVGLFSVQSRGTASLGAVFGRIMLVWFAVLAVLGALSIAQTPGVLAAVNPVHAVRFFADNGMAGFLGLGAIFLVVTGGEALYADMGHFGRGPIALGWATVVFPALVLNYFGQAALLLRDPEAIESPLFLLAPSWALVPLVLLATMATVIASQALISGVFSLSVQAIQQHYLPRLRVVHTSDEERGQVYLPAMNAALAVACIALVLSFRSSTNLAAAYGVAVTSTMLITSILFAQVAIERFGWPRVPVFAGMAVLGLVDAAFLAANLFKIPDGGWFPLVAGLLVFALMTTWSTGRRLLRAQLDAGGGRLADFAAELPSTACRRVPGTIVFLYSRPDVVPPALVRVARDFDALHERVICLTVEMAEVATVPPAERLSCREVGAGIETWVLTYGFRDRISVPEALAATAGAPHAVDEAEVVYVLGREQVRSTARPGMARWRERLFGLMLRNSTDAARFFDLPADRSTAVGHTVDL
jgi:KUP system potassium uptake protein